MKRVFLILVVLVLFLGGCGSTSNSKFTIAINGSIESLDFANASYKQTFDLFSDIFSNLTEANAKGELVNAVAQDIQVSDDGLVYTIKLRDDVVWVDNTGAEKGPVTANDFVFSWQRMVNPATASSYAYIFEPIKNATKITSGELAATELGVEAVDDKILEITLENPVPYFPSMLAHPIFGPISEEAYSKYGEEYGTSAETTWYNGPFYITDYTPDAEVHLNKNELYYDANNVELENIVYKVLEDSSTRYNAFKTGELNVAEINSSQDIEEARSEGVLEDTLTGYSYYMILNQNSEAVTSNENLKKALAYGFDRERIEEIAYGGNNNVIEYIVPEGFTGIAYDGIEYRDYTDSSLIAYDEEKAQKYFDVYMQEMGYTDRSQIELEYISRDGEEDLKLSDAVKASYKQTFGITINITTLPFEQYVDKRQKGDFDMTITGWGPDYADPSSYLGIWQSSGIGQMNYPQYSNKEYDKLYTQAVNETDIDKRMEDFAQVEKKIVEDCAVLPFYQKVSSTVISNEYTVPMHMFMHVSHKYVTTTS